MKRGLSKTPLWMSEAFTEVNMLHLPGLQNIWKKKTLKSDPTLARFQRSSDADSKLPRLFLLVRSAH